MSIWPSFGIASVNGQSLVTVLPETESISIYFNVYFEQSKYSKRSLLHTGVDPGCHGEFVRRSQRFESDFLSFSWHGTRLVNERVGVACVDAVRDWVATFCVNAKSVFRLNLSAVEVLYVDVHLQKDCNPSL